jgi:hypothetical protein
MPAYSFKAQFVDPIKRGHKKQTIRGKRKHQAKPGDPLYLYYAMRTKYCTKILDATCTKVDGIVIKTNGSVYVNGKKLNLVQKSSLAILDGFATFTEMMAFWKENNSLPFKGDIIHWKKNEQ